jgi:hypothetical protein
MTFVYYILSRATGTLLGLLPFREAVLKQLRHSHYYSPAVSPIYLQKAEGVASRGEVASLMGPIAPTDELYRTVAAYIGSFGGMVSLCVFTLVPIVSGAAWQ